LPNYYENESTPDKNIPIKYLIVVYLKECFFIYPMKRIINTGIYQIKSIQKEKIYIGSAVSLKCRKSTHFKELKDNTHSNKHLQNHVNKYGIEDLVFIIMEFCSKEKLIEREQYWMDTLKPEFNICRVAGSALGVKWSEEQKQKIRGENNPMKKIEVRQKVSQSRKGFILSKEARLKISIASKGRKHTEGSLVKMSNNAKGNKYALGSKHSEDQIQIQRNLAKKSWETVEFRQKISSALKGNKNASGHRNRHNGKIAQEQFIS